MCKRCGGSGSIEVRRDVLYPVPAPPEGYELVYRKYDRCPEDDCDALGIGMTESWSIEKVEAQGVA